MATSDLQVHPPATAPSKIGAQHYKGGEGFPYDSTRGAQACGICGKPIPAGPAWRLDNSTPREEVKALAHNDCWLRVLGKGGVPEGEAPKDIAAEQPVVVYEEPERHAVPDANEEDVKKVMELGFHPEAVRHVPTSGDRVVEVESTRVIAPSGEPVAGSAVSGADTARASAARTGRARK